MITADSKTSSRGCYQYSASVTVSPLTEARTASGQKLNKVNMAGFAFVTWTHHRPNLHTEDCVAVATASALCDYWITLDGQLEIGFATLHRVEEYMLYTDGHTRLGHRYSTAKICKDLIKSNYYDDYCNISREIVEAVIKETALARLEHGVRVAIECELDIKP